MIDLPINIGNRPPHGPPANIPITFELAVLLAGGSSFFGFFTLARLPQPYHPVFESEDFRARRRSTPSSCRSSCRPASDADKALADVRAAGRAVGARSSRSPSDDARGSHARCVALALALAGASAAATRTSSTRWPIASRKAIRYKESNFYADGLSMRRRPRAPCRASASR